jgi:hypothetical protein
MDKKEIRVLFLSANPTNNDIRIDQEVRDIEHRIKMGKYRKKLKFISKFAVRPNDIHSALLEVDPHIVHLSGHGDRLGSLIVENPKKGEGKDRFIKIKPAHLAETFGLFYKNLRCVLISACYSDEAVDAIHHYISFVIGIGALTKKEYNRLEKEEAVFSLVKSLGVCWDDQEGNLSFYPFLSSGKEENFAEMATIRLRYQFEFLPEDFWLRLVGALRQGIYSIAKSIWSLYEVFSNLEVESKFKINNYFDANLLEIIIVDSIQESYSGQAVSEVEETVERIQHTYPYPLSFRKQILRIPPTQPPTSSTSGAESSPWAC